MNRRTLLRGLVGAGVGGGAALAGVAVASEDAGAQTALTLDVAGDSATVGSDADVTAVDLAVDVSWEYALPDAASPDTVVVELAAGTDALTVVATDESATLFTESDGEASFDVDLLDAGALEADALAPEGGSRDTTVTVEARLRVEDSGGDVLARDAASDTATVTVERAAAAEADVGGSGSLTIETE